VKVKVNFEYASYLLTCTVWKNLIYEYFRTTDETLKDYVTKFGEVTDSLVMKDQNGQSKCFGFVTFTDPNTVDEFMKQRPHTLDGRYIDPKRASKHSSIL
jgi:RNA recognition motif-containing protein